jgi:class 3 adenylate cyclase
LIGPTKAAAPKQTTGPQIKIADTTTSEIIEGERKTVTALFADIKGSMELMEDLDPEEARAVVDPTIKLMMSAVDRYDGYIVQSTGDGIFAIFEVRPWRTRTIRIALSMLHSECKKMCGAIATSCWLMAARHWKSALV